MADFANRKGVYLTLNHDQVCPLLNLIAEP